MLALAALIAAYLISIGISRSQADISNEQQDRDMAALRQAKAALIAYAASEAYQRYRLQVSDQPGALPCPDINTNTGTSFGGCNGSNQRVGRFPFATIGSEDLRDSSGERLWYAVSSNFYKSSTNVINSDKQGLLNVTGKTPASNVVAIVFAPGLPVQDSTAPGTIQNRSGANVFRLASYLEGYTVGGSNYTFTSSDPFSSGPFPSPTFNDRLMVITQAELMAAVEPAVAARIERDVIPIIQNYYTGWHVYPFPAPFDPTKPQSAFQGDKNQTRGVLPITAGPTTGYWLEWDPSSVSVTQISGGTGSGAGPFPPNPYTISPYPPDCSASTKDQISCVILYTGSGPPPSNDRPKIQVQATLRKATLAFARPYTIWDAKMTDINDYPVAAGIYAQWSGASPIPPTVSMTVLPNREDATVVFQGVLLNPSPPFDGTGGKVTLTIGFTYAFNDPAVTSANWFIQNEWFRQTYYAVSEGFLAGGGNACNPPATFLCLTVNNLRPAYTNKSDKQAILLFAGRSLTGATRASTTLSDYFEKANLVAAGGTALVYENRMGAPSSINDRVVVVSP